MSGIGVIRVKPPCFGSDPTPQEEAENCCHDCPHTGECLAHHFRNKLTERKQETMSSLSKQEGGTHYKDLPIQPVEYIHANAMGYFEGCVLKYISRWRKKNGLADLQKAKHYIDLLIELETRNAGKRD